MGLKKLGVLVDSLGHSQLTHAIWTAAKSRPSIDVMLFYERLATPPWPLPCARMHVAHASAFDGPLVATNFSTALTLRGLVMPSAKFFLAWDLEWLHWPHKDFTELLAVYGSDEYILTARSASHREILANAWNREVALVDGARLETFFDHIVGPSGPVKGKL